jgi:ribonuclease-3
MASVLTPVSSATNSATPSQNVVAKLFNPWNPRNREITPSDALSILRRYGWKGRIKNFKLFQQACVHKSYVDRPDEWQEAGGEPTAIAERPSDCLPLREEDYERIEFLGDRVIGLIVSTYLFKRYGDQGEGFLTRLLSGVVNNKQLGKLAKKIGLRQWIILSRHMEDACDGRNNLRILGSVFEAWMGAMYLQEEEDGRGISACHEFLLRIIETHIDFIQLINEDTNYKHQLLCLFQSRYHVPPRYKEVEVEGPPHDRIFTMGVVDPTDKVIAKATARNKKVAEQEASRLALEVLMTGEA